MSYGERPPGADTGFCIVWAIPPIALFVLLNAIYGATYWIALLISIPIGLAIAYMLALRLATPLRPGPFGKDVQLLGCWMIFVFLFCYVIFVGIAQRAAWNKKYHAAQTEQEKALLRKELNNLGVK
jgi:ethanolamine transporter EutH